MWRRKSRGHCGQLAAGICISGETHHELGMVTAELSSDNFQAPRGRSHAAQTLQLGPCVDSGAAIKCNGEAGKAWTRSGRQRRYPKRAVSASTPGAATSLRSMAPSGAIVFCGDRSPHLPRRKRRHGLVVCASLHSRWFQPLSGDCCFVSARSSTDDAGTAGSPPLQAQTVEARTRTKMGSHVSICPNRVCCISGEAGPRKSFDRTLGCSRR